MSSAPSERQQHSRISPRTLVIASTASACAAYVVSQLWAPGTLIGAAVTPVIVAVVSELLRKPIEAVPSPSAALAPLKGAVGAEADAADAEAAAPSEPPPAAAPPEAAAPPPAAPPETAAPPPAAPLAAAAAAGSDPVVREYRRTDYSTYDRGRVRIVLLTAALAFAIAVGFYVIADITTGSPITGGGGSSSLFDTGGRKHRDDRPATTTPTTTTPTQTTPQQQTTPTTPAPQPGATQTTPDSRTPAPPPQTAPAPAPQTTTPEPAAPQSRDAAPPPPASTTP